MSIPFQRSVICNVDNKTVIKYYKTFFNGYTYYCESDNKFFSYLDIFSFYQKPKDIWNVVVTFYIRRIDGVFRLSSTFYIIESSKNLNRYFLLDDFIIFESPEHWENSNRGPIQS